MTSRRFARAEQSAIADDPELLGHEVVDLLGGGQTRSSVELITDLGVSYDDLQAALRNLLDSRLVEVAYESDDERFYSLTDVAIAALKAGEELSVQRRADAAELATDSR